MLQAEHADDYVIATGVTRSVRDFVGYAAEALGISLAWEGNGQNEIARDAKSGKTVVQVNPAFYRPAEVDLLIGDASKAKRELGWTPEHDLASLVEMMARADSDRVATGVVDV
jgi:GDPmannose 4,6-dehydratase